jgi:hypothetical protein
MKELKNMNAGIADLFSFKPALINKLHHSCFSRSFLQKAAWDGLKKLNKKK